MMRAIVISLVITATAAAAENENQALVMLKHGGEYYRGTFPHTGSWLGLFCEGAACRIQGATVSIGDSTATDVLGDKELTEVIHASGLPIAVFNGVALPEGEVQTWFRQKDYFTDQPYKNLKSLGKWRMPWGAIPLDISWVRLANGTLRYHISDGIHRQFLFAVESEGHYGGDTTPDFYWVGDMDRDGRVDMILSLPDDNCGFDVRLYLSSTAQPGEFVHKAAQLSGRAPACGC